MEFTHDQNEILKRNWYSEIDKPNRLVYFQSVDANNNVEDINPIENLRQDRTTEFNDRFEKFAGTREKSILHLGDIAWKLQRDKYGKGLAVRSNVDADINAMIESAVQDMKADREGKADRTAEVRLGFFKIQGDWCEMLLGKAKITAEEYQILMESIGACTKIEDNLNERISEKQQDIEPYRALSERGIIARYEDARFNGANRRLLSAIKAITNSEYRGYIGLDGRKHKYDREVGNLERLKKAVQEKRARLEAKKAQYDEKINQKKEGISKGLEAVKASFEVKTERFAKLLASEFGINLTTDDKINLGKMLQNENDGYRIDGKITIKGQSCETMKQLLDALGMVRPLTSKQKDRLAELRKSAREIYKKQELIENRMASKGLNRFSEDRLQERKEGMDAKKKWPFIFGKMKSILIKGADFRFNFGKNEGGLNANKVYEFEVAHNSDEKGSIVLTSPDFKITFTKEGVVSIFNRKSKGTKVLEQAKAVKFIEDLKSVKRTTEKEKAGEKLEELKTMVGSTVEFSLLGRRIPQLLGWGGEWQVEKKGEFIELTQGEKLIRIPLEMKGQIFYKGGKKETFKTLKIQTLRFMKFVKKEAKPEQHKKTG